MAQGGTLGQRITDLIGAVYNTDVDYAANPGKNRLRPPAGITSVRASTRGGSNGPLQGVLKTSVDFPPTIFSFSSNAVKGTVSSISLEFCTLSLTKTGVFPSL